MRTLLFALLAACGGVDSPLLDGGTESDGADSASDAQDNCPQLLASLDAKQATAIQCCTTCNSLQCTQQIEGLCCPLTVTSADSLSAKDYLAALKAVRDAH